MRSLRTKHTVLIALNAALWSMVGLMGTGKIKLNAVRRTEVEIITTPARVRILIDGATYGNGNYFTTPATIKFPPGRHKITLQRAGYHSNSSTIVSNLGEVVPPIQSVLEVTTSNLQEVNIESNNPDDAPRVDLTLDGGLETGTLPLTATDLLPGVHYLDITTGLISKSTFRCQFEVPTTVSTDPIRITVDKQGKKLKVIGCKRLKNTP